MRAGPGERVGVLIVRAWLSPDAGPAQLRVRLTATDDVADRQTPPRTVVVDDAHAAGRLLVEWLLAFPDDDALTRLDTED